MSRTGQDIIEIGRDLIATKEDLGHGNFLPWIEAEFGMSVDTAGRFMNVAKNLAGQIPHSAEFEPSVLYALAAPSTHETVREEVMRSVEDGRLPTGGSPCPCARRAASIGST